jgi:hypothetical protein
LTKNIPTVMMQRVGAPMTKKAGRPKGSVAEQKRTKSVMLRLFAQEYAAYQAAAKRDGLPTTAWMRNRLNRIAREETE